MAFEAKARGLRWLRGGGQWYPSPMNSVSSIALSGLSAQSTRLNGAARNIARLTTTAPTGKPEQVPVLTTQQSSAPGGGTRADLVARPNSALLIPDPSSPFADAQGTVLAPGVPLAEQVSTLIQAEKTYAANVDVLKVDSAMMDALLDLV